MTSSASALPLGFAFILLLLLIVSFRSRPVVFCQYLKRMTGIELSPREVRELYKVKGPEGVRDLFLDLIIKEDLKTGSLQIPDGGAQSVAPNIGPEAAELQARTPERDAG
jgi:hypothetical protein